MAILLSELQHKSVSETLPGELFRIPLRGELAICIMLEPQENGQFLIGIIQSPGVVDRPSFMITDGKIPCVSYGSEWAIEPHYDGASFPSNGYGEFTARTLYLASGKALMRFDRPQNPNSYEYVLGNLLGGGHAKRENNDVPVADWCIWASADERDRPHAVPIVKFEKVDAND